MSKKPKKERWLELPYWMMRTEAWMTMPPDAKAVWLHLAMRYDGRNNGYISYAIREAKAIGLSKDRADRAIDVLLERGFLAVTRPSGFSVKTRLAREFRLTHLSYGPHQTERATKDFIYWKPPQNLEHSRKKEESQSHQCDRGPEIEIKEFLTVAQVRPSPAAEGVSQSHQCDTSKLPRDLSAGLAPALPAPIRRRVEWTVRLKPPPRIIIH